MYSLFRSNGPAKDDECGHDEKDSPDDHAQQELEELLLGALPGLRRVISPFLDALPSQLVVEQLDRGKEASEQDAIDYAKDAARKAEQEVADRTLVPVPAEQVRDFTSSEILNDKTAMCKLWATRRFIVDDDIICRNPLNFYIV